ncbi:outer membrane beta-barrel protein [Niabella sp. 22666]|uniref:outer membrane beta-barrel protein n=1 Tax=Niabella sp. 22666 TaxID=3453954 RepID=UPI003F86A47D
MKKSFFLYLFVLISMAAVPFKISAQTKRFHIGPYADLAAPVGIFANDFKTGVGGGAGIEYQLTHKLHATASVSYLHFRGKTTPNHYIVPDLGAIPVSLGLKYYINRLYFKLDAGRASYTAKSGNPYGGYYHKGAFTISPGLGVRIKQLDVQARAEIWKNSYNTTGFAGMRAGWYF